MSLRLALACVALVVAVSACTDLLYPPPTPLPAQPACREADPAALCVVVLGDSIGAGVPLEGDARWWVQLEAGLRDAFPGRPVAVESWAVPKSRIDVLESAAKDQAALATYDVAIIVEGVNDVGHTSIEEWSRRYADAVATMESKGLRVVMAAPPPDFVDGRMQARHDAVDEAVRALGTATRPVLDIAARFRADGDTLAATYYSDNLHQAAPGQAVIATMALDVVRQLVDAPGS